MKAAWIAIGSVFTAVVLLFTTIGIWNGFARARPPVERTSRNIPFTGSQLKIEAVDGNVSITITAGEAGVVALDRRLRWSKETPKVTEDWDVATSSLRLSATCPSGDQPDGPICTADYQLEVPIETRVEAKTTRGPLWVDRLHGDLRLTTVSGDVRVAEGTGRVWVRSGSGDIALNGLEGGQADAETGAGNVDLAFRGDPPSDVRAVASATGNVTAWLPKGATYNLTTTAKQSAVGVDRDPSSPRKINLSAPDGRVSVFYE